MEQFLLFGCNYFFLVFWVKFIFWFFCVKKIEIRLKFFFVFLSWSLLAASRRASQKINLMVVQFKPRDTVALRSEVLLDYELANPLEVSKPVTRKQSPIEIVVLRRCKVHQISFWWSSKTSLASLVRYMSFCLAPFQPMRYQPFTISTNCLFDRLPFRPLANSTSASSTHLLTFKVIQFFQDVGKHLM